MILDKKNDSKKINLITINKIGKVDISNKFDKNKVKKFIYSQLLK